MALVPRVSQKTGILFISSAEHAGADRFIHALITRHLDRSRFDVHVAGSAGAVCARTAAYDVLAKVPDLTVLPANFGPSPSARSGFAQFDQLLDGAATLAGFAGLVRYVRRHRISVLHSTDRPRDALACAVLGKLTGARSLIHAHLKCADWIARSLRWSMGQVDALAGVSEFVSRSLLANGYARDKIHTVLNAIDATAWDYRLDGGPVRRQLGIPTGAPVIACAGRLFRGKGQDDLIRALPAVREKFPALRVLIIGGDDLMAMRTSFTTELKALARDLDVVEQVIFTGHRSDMPALMAACDVFTLPSHEEPFGLVFLEAMAMKKPVVALDSGGVPEIVEHGKSGLLSKPGDLDALSGNLLHLFHNPALRVRFGEYGRQQVETRFPAARMAEDSARIYTSL
jgi:glycosyltransferase involved in cell wall biosynthesis